jgi:hypothetical protein
MIPSLGMFLSSDFQGDAYSKCDYCGCQVLRYDSRTLRLDRESMDRHVALVHMPPSEVSRELRRNIAMGHP